MNFSEEFMQKLAWYHKNTMELYRQSPYDLLYHPETGLFSVDEYVIQNMDADTKDLWLNMITQHDHHTEYEDKIIKIVSTIPLETIPDVIIQTQAENLAVCGVPLPDDMAFDDSDVLELVDLHKEVIKRTVKLF
jgi:hypothetical protein